jgi:Cu/Ag efflux pump CusA
MVYLIRGKIPTEEANPINRWSMALYEPFFHAVMRHPVVTLAIVIVLGAVDALPVAHRLEFMPPLEEGDLLYMPTTDPSISVTKSKELLQQTDKLIATFPEVQSVHGKIGRADTRHRSGAAVDDRDGRAAAHRPRSGARARSHTSSAAGPVAEVAVHRDVLAESADHTRTS